MNELFRDALFLVEDDAKWLDDSAQHCEDLARNLAEDEKSKWRLTAAMYQERAERHRELAAKMRRQLAG